MVNKIVSITLLVWAIVCLVVGLYLSITLSLTSGISHLIMGIMTALLAFINYNDKY